MKRKLLFLCTGNYYRSRFAEILFNALAEGRALDWIAESRGLAVDEAGQNNVGPISHLTTEGLAERGIKLSGDLRFPLQANEADFQQADLIVAVKEAEHRTLMEQRFPRWVEQVEYWHIHDLNVAQANEALPILESAVRGLVERLQA